VPPAVSGPDTSTLAAFPDRLVAAIIDGVLTTGLLLVLTAPLTIFLLVQLIEMSEPRSGDIDEVRLVGVLLLAAVTVVVWLLVRLAIGYLYCVELTLSWGQTVGKRIMKLRIVRLDSAGGAGQPGLSREVAVRRWLVKGVLAKVVAVFGLADGLWQLWDEPYRQCLHDKFAGTVVVKVPPVDSAQIGAER